MGTSALHQPEPPSPEPEPPPQPEPTPDAPPPDDGGGGRRTECISWDSTKPDPKPKPEPPLLPTRRAVLGHRPLAWLRFAERRFSLSTARATRRSSHRR